MFGALRERLRALTGRVPWWGFTGPPGVGKSTLIDALLTRLRQRGRRVGVVAVDPTSPLSHGALLGDRVRMMRHALDPEVFIRSLATHGRAGGLSDATLHCARLLELAGFDPVLIETVGVGQNEAGIAEVADLCVVLLGPGYGDDVQLIKAGLLEIADLLVVNKCDLPDANRLLNAVRQGPTAPAAGARVPATMGIEARSGQGVDELLEELLALDRAARSADRRGELQQKRILGELRRSATLSYEQALEHRLQDGVVQELIGKLARGALSLETVVAELNTTVVAKPPKKAAGAVSGAPAGQEGKRG